MNKKHAISAIVILALIAGVGWGLFSGEDQEVNAAKQQRDEIFQKMDTLTPEQRNAEFTALKERTANFSEAQRRALWEGGRRFMMQKVDNLLAMPKAERNAELDKWIDRMEQGRKTREANGGGRGGPGAGGGPGNGDKPRGGGANRGKQMLDKSTPEMRAKMDAMKDLINARREERGMDPIKGGRFGRGR